MKTKTEIMGQMKELEERINKYPVNIMEIERMKEIMGKAIMHMEWLTQSRDNWRNKYEELKNEKETPFLGRAGLG